MTNGLNYKPMRIVNDYSLVSNKLEASLTDDARVVICDRHMFIVKATDWAKFCMLFGYFLFEHFFTFSP